MKILVLQGPNLNLLGTREPDTYGAVLLSDVTAGLDKQASAAGVDLEHAQSNHEGEIVDRIQLAANSGVDGIVLNPGAYTHSSIAIRDALLSTGIPFMEIHISNVYARESFRHKSMFSDIAAGVIVGCGTFGYTLALTGMIERLRQD